jgi:hypothetical protein
MILGSISILKRLPMNNIKTQTVKTVAKDQTIEDIVRESPVDQHQLKFRRRWGIIVLIIIFLIILF